MVLAHAMVDLSEKFSTENVQFVFRLSAFSVGLRHRPAVNIESLRALAGTPRSDPPRYGTASVPLPPSPFSDWFADKALYNTDLCICNAQHDAIPYYYLVLYTQSPAPNPTDLSVHPRPLAKHDASAFVLTREVG